MRHIQKYDASVCILPYAFFRQVMIAQIRVMYPSLFEKNKHQSQPREPQVKVQEANAAQ